MKKQHPRYDPYANLKQFDFALLKLSKPAKISDTVGVVCLPMNQSNLYDGEELTVSGWGRIIYKGIASPVLRAAHLQGRILFAPSSTP